MVRGCVLPVRVRSGRERDTVALGCVGPLVAAIQQCDEHDEASVKRSE